MISKWDSEQILQRLGAAQRERLEDFLEEVQASDLNRAQRIILVAEAFDCGGSRDR